jgi:hypothetical protein
MSTTSPNGAVTPTAAAISEIGKVLAALPESWNRHDMVAYASYFTDDADSSTSWGCTGATEQPSKPNT